MSEVQRMPQSKGFTIRVPDELLIDMRRAKLCIEVSENRTVSLNEIIIRAMREFVNTHPTIG